jgi:hypothetical protein
MGFFDDVAGFFTDVINVVLTPFKTVFETVFGEVSSATKQSIENIEGAVGLTPDDIGNFAKEVVDAGGSILHTGEDIVGKGADTLFGAVDVMKYVPYLLLGIGGIFLVNNADKILDIGDRKINK